MPYQALCCFSGGHALRDEGCVLWGVVPSLPGTDSGGSRTEQTVHPTIFLPIVYQESQMLLIVKHSPPEHTVKNLELQGEL